ncbi:MAG: hypothetical protein WC760_10755 [Bacteroidia bacterium]|jgi:hypothetical protein
MTFLASALFIGSPIEIATQPGHRIGTLCLGLVIGTTIFFTFKQSNKLEHQGLRFVGIVLTSLITIPYVWISLWTIPQVIYSSDYPMWQDVVVYTNDNDEKVVGQFIEISGSLHASQNVKIYHDFGNGIRVSLSWPDSRLNGKWIESKHGKIRTVYLVNGRETE